MAENATVKILMVEDEQNFAEILSTKLEKEGFDVIVAQNGELGVAAAKELKPDLILMDIKMPVMNGIEAFYKLKDDPQTAGIKLIFLTNYGEPDKEATWLDEKFSREIGATDYIKKTDDLSKIVGEIRRVLEQ